jgi:transcriptional regulator with PAS, ATPase and Fis domain
VLITGESGTGKELFAQAIHHSGSRKLFPFVRINCAAIPKDLLETELFGYERGAFTGARSRGKPGKVELAHKGTLFLDEIGDLPMQMQPKLLSVLEEKTFERVGGMKLRKSDFRLVAATNQDLDKMMTAGTFRKDLFYRLNVIPMNISPLRERPEDITVLSRHFVDRLSLEAGLPTIEIEKSALEALECYEWPGNVRELSNVIESVIARLDADSVIRKENLPFYIKAERRSPRASLPMSIREVTKNAERDAIVLAMKESGNNKSEAARRLGIHRTQLYKKLRKYGLHGKSAGH